MESDYVRQYRRLYNEHWWWRAREHAVLSVIERHHQSSPTDRVLDIGCGDGLFFDQLTRFGNVSGLEADSNAVSPDNPHAESIHIGPFDSRYQPNSHFQLITMLDVLEHLPDDVDAAARVASLLDPDGTFVLTVPAFMSLWTSHDDMNQHVTRYRRGQLVALLEAAGLDVLSARYLFHWVACAKIATRAKEAVFGGRSEPPAVPSRSINSILRWATHVELRGGRGLGIPFGSSIIAVAKKKPAENDNG